MGEKKIRDVKYSSGKAFFSFFPRNKQKIPKKTRKELQCLYLPSLSQWQKKTDLRKRIPLVEQAAWIRILPPTYLRIDLPS